MRPEPILPRSDGTRPFNLGAFAREVVLSGILAVADDKAEMKHRVMLARECGFLNDQETREWIVKHGLEAA